jgi:hypothetical protein
VQNEDKMTQQEMLTHLTEIIRASVQSGVESERERCAKIAEAQEDHSGKASYTYDGGSGSIGYESACRDIAAAIRSA